MKKLFYAMFGFSSVASLLFLILGCASSPTITREVWVDNQGKQVPLSCGAPVRPADWKFGSDCGLRLINKFPKAMIFIWFDDDTGTFQYNKVSANDYEFVRVGCQKNYRVCLREEPAFDLNSSCIRDPIKYPIEMDNVRACEAEGTRSCGSDKMTPPGTKEYWHHLRSIPGEIQDFIMGRCD